jgi:hypothetical protein
MSLIGAARRALKSGALHWMQMAALGHALGDHQQPSLP